MEQFLGVLELFHLFDGHILLIHLGVVDLGSNEWRYLAIVDLMLSLCTLIVVERFTLILELDVLELFSLLPKFLKKVLLAFHFLFYLRLWLRTIPERAGLGSKGQSPP
jgi:hypothetical protein